MPKNLLDEFGDDSDRAERFERIRRRGPSRHTLKSVADLLVSDAARARIEAAGEMAPRFSDRSLQELHERGLLDEILVQLKSGKEATVYVGKGSTGTVAVKLYRELLVRSFRNDSAYREGRFIGDARIKRAIEHATRNGQAAHDYLWIEEEYRQLVGLLAAGVSVPRPLGRASRAIVMEFVGDGVEPSPRLSDMRLSDAEAASAFEQAVENLRLIVASGRVHGDYSAFNLLWDRGRVVVIDFPQVVYMHESARAGELLRRDIHSLCRSFHRHGINPHEELVLQMVIDPEELRRIERPDARLPGA